MKIHTGTLCLCMLFSGTFASFAMAQNQLSLGELKPGQLVLNLSITEQQNVDQDTLNASLQFIAQGRKKIELQNEVNAAMQAAVNKVKANPAVEFNTTYYQVQIVQTGRPAKTDIANPVYRASQAMNLHSTDSAALLELIGLLQEDGLLLNGLYYTLSETAHEKVAGELLESALMKLQHRAQDAAAVLGKKQAELVEVSMDGTPNFMQGRQKFSMAAMASSDAEFVAPVAEPGETMISVSVSARAVLSP